MIACAFHTRNSDAMSISVSLGSRVASVAISAPCRPVVPCSVIFCLMSSRRSLNALRTWAGMSAISAQPDTTGPQRTPSDRLIS